MKRDECSRERKGITERGFAGHHQKLLRLEDRATVAGVSRPRVMKRRLKMQMRPPSGQYTAKLSPLRHRPAGAETGLSYLRRSIIHLRVRVIVLMNLTIVEAP